MYINKRLERNSLIVMIEEERIVNPSIETEDIDTEVSLRPKTLDSYIGQEKVKSNMKIFINAAKKRGDSLDHVLLYGPPGLRKNYFI